MKRNEFETLINQIMDIVPNVKYTTEQVLAIIGALDVTAGKMRVAFLNVTHTSKDTPPSTEPEG